jgi:pyruvate-formate lyase
LTMHHGKGSLEDFTCVEDILNAYKDQLEFYLQFPPIMDSVTSKTYEVLTPTPFLSMLIDNRMESGLDISRGIDNKTYHNLLIEAHGSINVGNSIAAIKKLVFDEKKLTTIELKRLLDNDFEGIQGERMRNLLQNAAPKYGNDDDYVDNIVRDTIKFYTDGITQYSPSRGGNYGPSTQGISCNVPLGAVVGATPDGRKAGITLADNTSPMPGTDHNGPTSVVKSASKIGQRAINNGTILNVKFHPTALQDDIRINKFCDFIRTYFTMEGFQVQFNVVSQEMLREAQKHPEDYKTLVVKVAGYSALFSALDERLQNQIIERTSHVFK